MGASSYGVDLQSAGPWMMVTMGQRTRRRATRASIGSAPVVRPDLKSELVAWMVAMRSAKGDALGGRGVGRGVLMAWWFGSSSDGAERAGAEHGHSWIAWVFLPFLFSPDLLLHFSFQFFFSFFASVCRFDWSSWRRRVRRGHERWRLRRFGW
ncbi:hypothetical protein M0R45_002326 [Rubus argutus]|uniref:Uncharacterized protein n=1 Tax=Rubus argutus TaxID=59490 RepID=A0AAW1VJV5_RUBAR